MDAILSWAKLLTVIELVYPKAGNGRRPYPLETLLRIHCLQHWYNLSDGAMPDRTTIMNFHHLLEQHKLAREIFSTINQWLSESSVMMLQGTLMDTTIIKVPSSTQNKQNQRDSDMCQTQKGNK